MPPLSRETIDTGAGITLRHCVAGIFIGRMGIVPGTPKIQSVLTVAAVAGVVPDGVHHRHQPLSYLATSDSEVAEAAGWVLRQTSSERTVLVRSEGGRQRPGLIVGMAVLLMGGYYHDAITCVRHARSDALTDFRYLALLKESDDLLNQRHRHHR